ncbi:Regulator of chromosome condensation 1/beta-lactamase-inhibitor protein II [Pseudocohnilembus persalinus]|uniref:Regulator of chromosome condensation 1/beta-lactamase-inhibitor protein II n=1 Tax=Pseudocohnilembus persalinus TaxID=266149 RepID=A0A0V0QPZ6_PSEPJ|nr:Regulator of chromosome condensation 1/beta-lactamase-inhibitor protein II [Pseudocohnilembus persalinus]|eukprot:KRX04278.1 Regulator of chromosome condensation 1/beta-lactamase-inhibitor protein II [Pseudocohnilembus persalinus]
MKISENLQAILNDKGQIFIKGTFFMKINKVLKFEEFTCISREQCFQSIALGDNHLIAICENKKLWGIGDNQKVYAFNDLGHIFMKDLQSKETLQKIVNDSQDSNFNDAIITQNEKFYLRAPFNPEKCTIQLIGDTHSYLWNTLRQNFILFN